MPVACSSSALTGQNGQLQYIPAATEFCLLDYTDFPAGNVITVPIEHDFRVGDPVIFTEEDGGKLDSAFAAGTQYYVVAVTQTTISVSATKGGTAITSGGAGGTGSEDTAGHINIKFDPFEAICQIQSWDLSIERSQIDVSTLPCSVGGGGGSGKYATFKKFQPGPPEGTGTITVIFTNNDSAMGNRLLDNVMLTTQDGARVRLVLNSVEDAAKAGELDLTNSMFIEADISLTSISTSVTLDEAITAEVGYAITGLQHLFKTPIG